jgi:peptidoglycan-N-acetylmuramic acid deacetylase
MKRFIYFFLALIIIFTLSSCKSENTSSFNDSSVAVTTSSLEETASKPQETVSEEEPVSSTQEVVSEVVSEIQPPPPPPTEIVISGNATLAEGETYTGLPSLPNTEYTVFDPENTRGISTERHGFSFGVAKNGQPHSITVNNQSFFDNLNSNALAWDNKSTEKVLYLTFDCGYPYQDLVPRILNTLNEKQVSAAFFVTMQYLKEAPYEVAAMINNGHIVGNHTVNHPVCTDISRQKLANELLGVDNYLRTNFGYQTKYFRYPTGAYSEDTLELVKSLGYRTAFWSIAHTDWDPANQPGVEKSFQTVTSRLHSGAVILLHSTSPDNVEILGRFIDYARNEGYTFKSLDEYAYWNQ